MSLRTVTKALVAVLLITSGPLLASAADDAEVGVILEQLQQKLSSLRTKALRLKLDYDKAAVIVNNMRAAQGRSQVDPRQVIALKQDLDRMSVLAKQLRSEMEYKAKQLGKYERPLRRRYPVQAESFRLYFRQLQSIRSTTKRVCNDVARDAPRRVRDVDRMLRAGFGNYMAQGNMVTARATTPTMDNSNTAMTGAVGTGTSRADEIRKRLRSNKTAEEEELDRFFGESDKDAATKMPPLMVDPSDNANVNVSASKPTMPPMMVIPSSGKKSTSKATRAPKPTRASQPTKAPAPTRATKAPAATKTPTKAPASSGDDDDDDDGFGGFDDFDGDAKKAPAPTKAAPKAPTKAPTKAPAKKSGDDDEDFDSFMDFEDGEAPMLNRESEVAMAPGQRKKFKLFSERIADEFKRHGVVERTAAPPIVRRQNKTISRRDKTRSFASRLKEEISRGLPDDESETSSAKEKAPRKGKRGRGLVEELMREIGRVK